MSTIVVIADDLTGALDTGVQFLRAQRSVVIMAAGSTHTQQISERDVVVINTESRHLAWDEAFNVVRSVALVIRHQVDIPFLYKKVDSTFRGNVAAELEALATVFPERSMVMAPALPSQGRTTRKGVCLVNGIPLDQTDFAQDPLNPVRDSYIPALLRNTNNALQPVRVSVENLSQWAEALENTPITEEKNPSTVPVAVVDASTDADLAKIATVVRSCGTAIISVGSAGLAAHMIAISPSWESKLEPVLDGPLLLINGSLNPTALRQTDQAIASGFIDIALNNTSSFPEIARSIAEHLQAGSDVCLRTVLQTSEVGELQELLLPVLKQQFPHCSGALHEMLPLAFGEITKHLLQHTAPGGILVFGGDTASGIMKTLGASTLHPIAELLPGVVVSTIQAPEPIPLFITKAGGFGSNDLAVQIINRMRRAEQ